jgi:hypothetical protein
MVAGSLFQVQRQGQKLSTEKEIDLTKFCSLIKYYRRKDNTNGETIVRDGVTIRAQPFQFTDEALCFEFTEIVSGFRFQKTFRILMHVGNGRQ